ncbi:hypothetical protein EIP86_008944 [Pleurotus ostreatoroseus]|nr:hypothetical protein EIP86_008944 [Pleurotus ostreatoroseus]
MTLISKAKALAVLADNAKHNQHGRIDEFGTIRHRHIELCAIGALALHFFCYFHVLNSPLPPLPPDFDNRDYSDSHVFPGKSLDSEMSYENHRTRIRTVHKHADIVITKVTHVGQVFTGTSTRSHGSSMDDTKALGG